ncbi:MAG: Lnb N-terminal periplasmic domain-containing protein [Planctomycetota bacterium]|jgi:hypothetical protein
MWPHADRDKLIVTAAQEFDSASPRARSRISKALLLFVIALLVAGMTAWGTLFLWFSNLPGGVLRAAMAGAFAIGTVASFACLKRRRRTLVAFLVVFAALVAWYFSIPPSNDRQWAPEVAVLPVATVNGNLVEIRNIRNFDYRTETDFTPRYYDKTFDLNKLQSVDLISVHWGIPAVAHVMGSFGFAGGDFVAFSIEMRREKGEAGAMLRSLFRKYELIYVVADERDVIRVRTNYRQPHEQVHIYRVRLPVENQRRLFLSYLAKVNQLARAPEWYNTIEDNCTTGVLQRAAVYKRRGRYNWKVLLSGYAAEYGHELGMLDTSMPFAELRERCLVNGKAEAAGTAEDFSERIREGVPKPAPYTLEEFEAPK